MATTEQQDGGSVWSSAREFVEDRLDEIEEPVTPCDLADEYDCSNAHMRHTLADLMEDEQAERVDHGEYVGVSTETAETESTDVEPEDPTENTGESRPSVDGAARSEGLATEDDDGVRVEGDERADVDISEMDQEAEYEQQLEEANETVDGEESDEIEADADDDLDDQGDGDGGLPPGAMVVIGTITLAILILVVSRNLDDDESEDQQEEQQEDDETGPVDPSRMWE